MRKKIIGWTLGCILALLTATSSQAADLVKSNGLKLNIPFNAVSYDVLPLWTAIESGLFKPYGLEVTTSGPIQSPPLVASLLSGESQFALSGPDAVISADLNGADIVVLTAGPQVDFEMFGGKDIHKFADLKGKNIGITNRGTSTDFITRYLLTHAGVDPEKDVTLLPMGTQENMVTGTLAGKIDGAVAWADIAVKAKELGLTNTIANFRDYDLHFYSASLIARKSWVESHRNDTLNVVRGYVAGVAEVARNRTASIAALSKYLQSTDAAFLDNAYQPLLKVSPKVPIPEASVIKTALNFNRHPDAKTADPARFIDPSFVGQLQQDGFIDSLYK